MDHDVIIVGGGPAGLTAALYLGRCRRRVLVLDTKEPRNLYSRGVHGFLTRDGTPPLELRRLALQEIAPFETVRFLFEEAVGARVVDGGFEVDLEGGESRRARKLLLATGLQEDLPDIAGLEALYGLGVYNCPYCDGYDHCGRPIAVLGAGEPGLGLALELTGWSRDLVLVTNGPADLDDEERGRLDRNGIRVVETPIERLEGAERFEGVRFTDGQLLPASALFFNPTKRQGSELAERLGLDLTSRQTIRTHGCEATNIPGLFVAGDASPRVQFAIVAAGEGAMAAFGIHDELIRDDLV